ncbi:MAG: CDP-diacylglycerol--glycerol-3-phosphate 3-phosphatidyltransferase [Clostridiales bacterium]|nr:CDP-diacylglycerol--glycerol-3-phosphate 3-phosphatidyltransferase [Clostridiales bacterium]
MSKMNLPNKLTVFRIIMVPVFLLFLAAPLPLSDTYIRIVTAVVFALTSLTDMVDGKIARKYNLITDFGKFMDPLADKFLVFAAMLGILVRFDYLRPVFVWAAAIVIFRELAVTSIRLVAAGKSGLVIAASWLGKVKTTTQMVCIVAILLEPVILPWKAFREYHVLSYFTIAAMTVMTLWSGIDYLKKYWKFLDPEK